MRLRRPWKVRLRSGIILCLLYSEVHPLRYAIPCLDDAVAMHNSSLSTGLVPWGL